MNANLKPCIEGEHDFVPIVEERDTAGENHLMAKRCLLCGMVDDGRTLAILIHALMLGKPKEGE